MLLNNLLQAKQYSPCILYESQGMFVMEYAYGPSILHVIFALFLFMYIQYIIVMFAKGHATLTCMYVCMAHTHLLRADYVV